MNSNLTAPIQHAATIAEIALMAGVGPATVDRVLNNRPHVRETTRQRVLQAKAALEAGNRPHTRTKPWRLKVLLPSKAGASTEYFASALQEFGSLGNATIECEFVKKMDPALLARKLVGTTGQGIDAVLFQALDHPRVVAAIEVLSDHNIPALSLLSGLVNSRTIGNIGIDNRAAGRTAGYLMGRLTKQRGIIAVVSGGGLYRGHEDREIGFRTVLRDEFKHIDGIDSLIGHDEKSDTYRVVKEALEKNSDLIGIYNVGSGNPGIYRALEELDVVNEIVFIGHHLTKNTKTYLLDGTMDIVLHVNMRAIAQQAMDAILTHLEGRHGQYYPTHLDVLTRENIAGVQLSS